MKTILLLILSTFFSWTFTTEQAPKPIHVEVSGNGNPIIFIPGFTVPGDVWNPVVKELEKAYECHVVTLAGFGGKAPIGFPWLPKVNDAL